MGAAVSIGATIFGALLGRKAVSASTLGRATTAARGMGRVGKESQDVARATENVDALTAQLERAARPRCRTDLQAVTADWDLSNEPFERVLVEAEARRRIGAIGRAGVGCPERAERVEERP